MTERDFVKSFCGKLKDKGFDITKIESPGTAPGIPDTFIQGNGFDWFVEFKRINKDLSEVGIAHIPWRPGQQAWAIRYLKAHKGSKCCCTIARYNNCIILIRHTKIFDNNSVGYNDYYRFEPNERVETILSFM
jgi:hypothetical protein